MRSLRTRFVISHLLPLLLIIPLSGAALFYIFETQIALASLVENLSRQAAAIAEVANSQSGIWTDRNEARAFVSALHRVNRSISLILPTGEIVASSGGAETGTLSSPTNLGALIQGKMQSLLILSLPAPSAQVSIPIRDINERVVGIVQVTQGLTDISANIGRLRLVILGTLGAELALGSLVGLILALRLEKPIQEVTEMVAGIASGQVRSSLIRPTTTEIANLVDSVNGLSDRLAAVEKERKQLVANVVHELGRPLGAMRSAVHVLRRGGANDPSLRQDLLTGLESELIRLEPLLNDLTSFYSNLAGQKPSQVEKISWGEWLFPLLAPWQAAAQEKGLDWSVEIDDDRLEIELDGARMGQAVGNLLSNAIKYTPAGGRVALRGRKEGILYLIDVADTGCGISGEDQSLIFDPFYRSQGDSRFPQGMGLGLSIARAIIQNHGGALRVYSRPGAGSKFTISLPIAAS